MTMMTTQVPVIRQSETKFTYCKLVRELLKRYCNVFGHRIFDDCMLSDHPRTNGVIHLLTGNILQTFSR